MELCEWDAKTVLREGGIPVPRASLVDLTPPAAAPAAPVDGALVVKAQLLQGGRGKAGLVRRSEGDPLTLADEIGARMQAMGMPPVVMLEEAVAVVSEFYLALVIDDVAGAPLLLVSAQGGIDVEEAGDTLQRHVLPARRCVRPDELLPALRRAGAPSRALGRMAHLGAALHRIMRNADAQMIEINPLGVTSEGRPIALDCKMSLDDSAAFRQPHARFALSARLALEGLTENERSAQRTGYVLVETPGDVVLFTAGAGLGMLCADLLAQAGFHAASFFDNAANARGDTSQARLDMAWHLARAPQCRAIAYYLALSSRDLAPRIKGLLARLETHPPPVPFYFGLTASFAAERVMTAAQARELVRSAGYPAFDSAQEMVAAMARDRDTGQWPAHPGAPETSSRTGGR